MTTRVLRQPPPDERFDPSAPPGYRWEWVTDPRQALLVAGDPVKCRRPGCQTPATWKLRRSNGWWSYCSDHHYGREIRDDGVFSRRLVPAGKQVTG